MQITCLLVTRIIKIFLLHTVFMLQIISCYKKYNNYLSRRIFAITLIFIMIGRTKCNVRSFMFPFLIVQRSQRMQIISKISCAFRATGIGMSHFCNIQTLSTPFTRFSLLSGKESSSVRRVYRSFLRLVNASRI